MPLKSVGQCGTFISTFPYLEDFENTAGGWISGGTGNDWAWGTPAKPVITGAGLGLKCWISGGLTNASYASGARSYVTSPCFDFTSLQNPYVTFKIFWETEKQYDGANFQYSTDGGITWTNTGSFGDPVDCRNKNWFNYSSVTNLTGLAVVKEGWSGNIQATSGMCIGGLGSNGWKDASHTMPYLAGNPQVQFRFAFGSGTTCNAYDGFAFDLVSIGEAPALPVLNFQSTQASCNLANGSATIQVTGGSGPYSYNWSPNVSSGQQAMGIISGTYTITVTDALGCTAVIQGTVSRTPDITLQISSLPDTCNTGKGSLSVQAVGGTPPFQYAWSTGNSSPFLNQLFKGTYTITVTDNAGCSSLQTGEVTDTGYFSIDLGRDFTICGPGQILLNPGNFNQYIWQDGSSLSTYEVFQPGMYTVHVENANGCNATDSIRIEENCLLDVLLPNAFTPNGDGYNDLFKGTGTALTDFQLEVYNRWGILLFHTDDISVGWDGSYNSRQSPQGLYAWKMIFTISGSEQVQKQGSVFLIR